MMGSGRNLWGYVSVIGEIDILGVAFRSPELRRPVRRHRAGETERGWGGAKVKGDSQIWVRRRQRAVDWHQGLS